MFDITRLMQISESASLSFTKVQSPYDSMSLEEACMFSRVQLLESEIEYHDLMDECANDMIDAYYNSTQGIALTEAAEAEQKEKNVSWFTKVKEWFINLFNRVIGWFKALGSKIASLFKKSGKQDNTAKQNANEKPEEKNVEKNTQQPSTSKEEPKEQPENKPEPKNRDITFTIKYAKGFGITNLTKINDVDALINEKIGDIMQEVCTLMRELREAAGTGFNNSYSSRLSELISSHTDYKAKYEEKLADTLLEYVNGTFVSSKSYSDYSEYLKDIKSSIETKEVTVNIANVNARSGYGSLDDKYIWKILNQEIDKESGVKQDLDYRRDDYDILLNATNKMISRADKEKKYIAGIMDRVISDFKNAKIDDNKMINFAKSMVSSTTKEVNKLLSFQVTLVNTLTFVVQAYKVSYNNFINAISRGN